MSVNSVTNGTNYYLEKVRRIDQPNLRDRYWAFISCQYFNNNLGMPHLTVIKNKKTNITSKSHCAAIRYFWAWSAWHATAWTKFAIKFFLVTSSFSVWLAIQTDQWKKMGQRIEASVYLSIEHKYKSNTVRSFHSQKLILEILIMKVTLQISLKHNCF